MTTENLESNPTDPTVTPVELTARPVRLTPEQETEAINLLKTSLASGKAGIARAIESILNYPWIVGVEGITQSWPDLKVTARRHLFTGLAAVQTEQALRFKMSLGRSLLTHDAASALKFIEAVCTEMLATEKGEPSQKNRQIFANVLIGKGKPWLLHLPLADLKPAGADKIIQCALATCFPGQCPPLTQLSVLRWIATSGRFAKLPESSVEAVSKAVKRWHPKLQAELKKDVPELPAPIEEALKTPPPLPVQPLQPPAPLREKTQPERRERDDKRQVPQSIPKLAPQKFDLVTALRQIEAHVNALKSELNQAKSEPRSQRHDFGKQGRREDRNQLPVPTTQQFEELQRHNLQLEETIVDLRQRMEDMAADHEDIATSMRAHDETPMTDEKEQFKALIGIKLHTNFTEFKQLAKEPQNPIYKEPFRLLLEEVFQILQFHGITLKDA